MVVQPSDNNMLSMAMTYAEQLEMYPFVFDQD